MDVGFVGNKGHGDPTSDSHGVPLGTPILYYKMGGGGVSSRD